MPISTGQAIDGAVATGLMVLVVMQFTNFLKYLRAQDWNGVGTQISVVVVAIAAIQLFAHSSFGSATIPGLDVPVSDLGWNESIIAALALFGAGGFIYDRTKARDNTQSAATPSLFPDAAPEAPPEGE